jgi:multiple sugar transport system permease protein
VLFALVVVSMLRPLVTPGAATVALYAFLAAWTQFLGALTFPTKPVRPGFSTR